MTRIVLNLSKH